VWETHLSIPKTTIILEVATQLSPNYLNHSVLKDVMMELNGGNIFNG
jgi:hypothetical protein